MIRAYLGPPGMGKTYSMVEEALRRVRETGCDVYTNMEHLRCPEAVYIDSLDELCDLSNGLVLLDEAGIALASRYWQEISRELLMRFAQVRKDGLDLWWTSQHENRVDTVLREITNEYVRCRRVPGGFWLASELPEDKKTVLRKRWVRFGANVARLYDTFGKIGIVGGSVGRGAGATQTTRAQRRNEADARRRVVLQRQARVRLYWQMSGVMYPRAATQEAYRYLAENGWLVQPEISHADQTAAGVSWQQQVEREIKRRAWLREWGLKPDDAPYCCTFESPWMSGYCPEAVRQRRLEAAMVDAEEDIKSLRKQLREAERKARQREQVVASFATAGAAA